MQSLYLDAFFSHIAQLCPTIARSDITQYRIQCKPLDLLSDQEWILADFANIEHGHTQEFYQSY